MKVGNWGGEQSGTANGPVKFLTFPFDHAAAHAIVAQLQNKVTLPHVS